MPQVGLRLRQQHLTTMMMTIVMVMTVAAQ